MSEDLKARLDASAIKLIEAIEQGGAFVVEQTPLVLHEYVTWYFWDHVIAGSLLILIPLFIVLGVYFVSRKFEDGAGEQGIAAMPYIFAGGVLILATIPIGAGIIDLRQALKAKVAPRVVVLDYLREQVR